MKITTSVRDGFEVLTLENEILSALFAFQCLVLVHVFYLSFACSRLPGAFKYLHTGFIAC